MIVGLFAIVRTAAIAVVAVVTRRVAHEAVLQRLVALLVPLEVTDHLFLLDENPRVAIEAMEVLPNTLMSAICQLKTSYYNIIKDNLRNEFFFFEMRVSRKLCAMTHCCALEFLAESQACGARL